MRSDPRGGHPTKLLTFHDAIEMTMVLTGDIARETRKQFADVLKRYNGGDASLINEIHTNALSDSPIARLARGEGAAADSGGLGKRAATGDTPNVKLLCVEIKKHNDAVIAAVTASSALTNGEVVKVGGNVVKFGEDVVVVKEGVERVNTALATIVDHAKGMEHYQLMAQELADTCSKTIDELKNEHANEVQHYKQEVADLKLQVGELRNEHANEVQHYKREVHNLEAEIKDLKNAIERHKRALKNAHIERNTLLNPFIAQMQALQDKIDTLSAAILH